MDVVLGKVGRAAVAQDAAAHPVGAHVGGGRMAQDGRAVAQRALARQVAGGLDKGLDLMADAARAVGVGEVRHQRDLVDLGQRIQPRPGAAQVRCGEAQAVHAAVHLQEDAVRLVRLVRGQPVDLLVAVHDMPEVQPRAQLEVARLEAAFQQQHRAAPAQVAHPLRLVEVEHRQAVGTEQARPDALDAVPVGVGLDDRPQPGVGCAPACAGQVAGEGVGMDEGFDRTGHDREIVPARSARFRRSGRLGESPRQAAWACML